MRRWAVVGGIVTLVVVIAVALVIVSPWSGGTSAAKRCQSLTYLGRESRDLCAGNNGKITEDGLVVIARKLARRTMSGRTLLCADTTYENHSNTVKNFNTLEWTLRSPSDKVSGFELVGAPFNRGRLGARNVTRFPVCFADHNERGQFVLAWVPTTASARRGIWLWHL